MHFQINQKLSTQPQQLFIFCVKYMICVFVRMNSVREKGNMSELNKGNCVFCMQNNVICG